MIVRTISADAALEKTIAKLREEHTSANESNNSSKAASILAEIVSLKSTRRVRGV